MSFITKLIRALTRPKTVADWLSRYNLTGDLDRRIAKKMDWNFKTPLSYHIEYEGSPQLTKLQGLNVAAVQVSLKIEYTGRVLSYDLDRLVQVRAIMVDYRKYPEFKFYGVPGNGDADGLTFIVTEHWVE